jgi:integrase
VQRQLLIVDGRMHLGPPKSAAGVRTPALDEFTNRFHALVRKLGLPPVRLHDLRHGAAGVELKVIQHDLGHSSAVTTADTYWTVFRELAHRAVAATAELLRSHARFRLTLGAASHA